MKKHTLLSITLIMGFFYLFVACLDKLPEPSTAFDCTTVNITYTTHVKDILDRTCNIGGCHDNSSQTSFGSYASLSSSARLNTIYSRVCVSKDMPQVGPSAALIDTINCWKEGGFIE